MTADTRSARDALHADWCDLTGVTLGPSPLAERLARGWNPQRIAVLRRLAAYAYEHRAAVSIVGGRPNAPWAGYVLAEHAHNALVRGASFDDVLPWLAVLAGDLDQTRSEDLGEQVSKWYRLRGIGVSSRAAGCHLASLAFAAGLSVEEVVARHSAGTLAAEDLAVLAGLRSYLLPDIDALLQGTVASPSAPSPTAADQDVPLLHTAWRALRNQDLPDVDKALAHGWTSDMAQRLLTIAHHAVASHAYIARLFTRGGETPPRVHQAGFILSTNVDFVLLKGGRFDDLVPWLLVLASDPDVERAKVLRKQVSGWMGRDPVLRSYSEEIGPLAPLAYAAGLTMEEARAQQQAGTLSEDTLLMLAGLRGYALPPEDVRAAVIR